MGSRNRQGRKTLTGAALPDGVVAELTDHETLHANPLSIVIFGATGDLAKKKLFPALYQLVLLGHLPRHVAIVGYGRKAVDLPSFVAKQCVNIKEDPRLPKKAFTERISFHGAGSSLALWHARHHCAATNFALALAFTEAIELMALLANRYSLVLD